MSDKKGFISKFLEKIDKKMKEKAGKSSCCCCSGQSKEDQKTEDGEKCC